MVAGMIRPSALTCVDIVGAAIVTNPPRLPRWIYLPAAAGAIFVVLPLVAMVAKVDWPRFGSLISSPSSTAALKLSLETSLASTVLCVLFGVPLALVLARTDGLVTRIVRPLILLPLVLPPVVGGIALLYAFGRLGLVGRYLESVGVQIAFTTVAVVLAQTFVSLPFLVISLEGRPGPRVPTSRWWQRRWAPRRRRCGGGSRCRCWAPV